MPFTINVIITIPFIRGIGFRRDGTLRGFDIFANFRGTISFVRDNIWSIDSSNWRATRLSWTCPPVNKNLIGFPKPSTTAWILVVRPPRLNSMAWFSTRHWAFFSTCRLLVSPDDRWILPYQGHQSVLQKSVQTGLNRSKNETGHTLFSKNYNAREGPARQRATAHDPKDCIEGRSIVYFSWSVRPIRWEKVFDLVPLFILKFVAFRCHHGNNLDSVFSSDYTWISTFKTGPSITPKFICFGA